MVELDKKAPSFSAKAYENGTIKDVSLNDYSGKWVILVFYPRDFTFICPTELTGFGKKKQELEAMGAVVIGASTDSEFSHKAWIERDLPDVTYPVLADTTQQISQEYGVLAEDGSAQRGTFIIDPEGVLKYMVVSSGSVGRSVTETVRVLQALQNGGLCPVEWAQGQNTLTPN